MHGDPKGFNPLLEDSEDVMDYLTPLAGASIAERNAWTNPDEWYGVNGKPSGDHGRFEGIQPFTFESTPSGTRRSST